MLQEWRDQDLHEYYYDYIGLLPVGRDGRFNWPSTEETIRGREEREEREELELAMALSMSMAQEHAATSESEGEGSDAVTVEQMAEVVAREWDLECRSGSEEGGEGLNAEEEWVVVEAEG